VRTIVITGGTDGIGRHVGEVCAGRGDRVVVIGRSDAKGEAFVRTAGPHATFRPADLGRVSENRAVIAWLTATYPAIDAVVLCARFYRSWRVETDEGIESTLAHFYLSRFLFCHLLRESLEQAGNPVIVNVAGPGMPLSVVHWDDLQLTRDYSGRAALAQGGKLNDLLGVSFSELYAHGKTRYVLVHPGVTATSQAGTYDEETLAFVEGLRRSGKPIAAAAEPIVEILDLPPTDPLSAFVEGRMIATRGPGFDREAARRLHHMTRSILGSQ
jgi:NAD(P)-dependent dehydrogenase (short-subunit alcohol dehydrogenase family)